MSDKYFVCAQCGEHLHYEAEVHATEAKIEHTITGDGSSPKSTRAER